MKVTKIALMLLLIGLVPAAFAQVTSTNLVGTVVDPSGAVVPNAGIEVENVATGVKATTTTGANGQYRFSNLPSGTYNIKASAAGFSTSSLKNVVLELSKTATANVQLEVGQISTVVEVVGNSITLDTTTPQIQTTIFEKDIVNLPIIENSSLGFFGALNTSLLSAGVSSNGGVGQGTGPSVGGQRPMNNGAGCLG